MQQPFRVGGPVTGEFFTNRAEEVEGILRAMRAPTRLLVRGLRRQGKTSAIAQAARRFRREGGLVLWADLSTAARLEDLRDRLTSSLPDNFFGRFEGLKKLTPVLEVRVDPVSGAHSYTFRVETRGTGETGVREQLRLLMEGVAIRAAAIGTPVAVVIDEIQSVRELDEPKLDWLLRDIMQSAGSLSFVCAGSQPSIIHQMTEEDAAFYRFFTPGPVFGPIEPDHLRRWIAHRMTAGGARCSADVAARIVEEVGNRTQDIMLLAQETFQLALPAGEASAATVDAALASIVAREADRFRASWDILSRNQRLVVRALARGVADPFAHGSIPELPKSSVQRALVALRAKKLLMDVPSVYQLDDPYFIIWVRGYAMPDSVPAELTD